jgi:hypothetical protein
MANMMDLELCFRMDGVFVMQISIRGKSTTVSHDA